MNSRRASFPLLARSTNPRPRPPTQGPWAAQGQGGAREPWELRTVQPKGQLPWAASQEDLAEGRDSGRHGSRPCLAASKPTILRNRAVTGVGIAFVSRPEAAHQDQPQAGMVDVHRPRRWDLVSWRPTRAVAQGPPLRGHGGFAAADRSAPGRRPLGVQGVCGLYGLPGLDYYSA